MAGTQGESSVSIRRKFHRQMSAAIVAAVIGAQSFQCSQAVPAQAASTLSESRAADSYASDTSDSTLTPGALEAATLLGIRSKVERLIALRRERSNQKSDGMSDEELDLRVDILDRVLEGSLEVRMVSDRIDRELAWAFAGQGMLQAKRQRMLNYLFTANFVQSGVFGVVSGPLFLHGLPIAGTEMLLLGSSIGLGLSTITLLETRSGHKAIDGETTVLASVFQLPQPEPPHRFDTIVKFMHSIPPQSTAGTTRIQSLIDDWKRGHYLRSMSESHLTKLAAVQPAADRYRENIKLISDRIRMLFDTQWTVQQFDGEMLDLMRAMDIN
jgi:hypothetical protein